ncbi:MAG: cation:proton antiporter [Leptospiraceae bacterium]|nr:cation:proton antiporter [Leptospiraceae bacterium]MCP5495314.1 cation:proton antiporter [Leptospiraceae bacterium]
MLTEDMRLLLTIILIAVISLIGSRVTFWNRQLPIGFKNILLTGTEYILIGIVLGGMGLGIFDKDTLDKTEPFLLFGLCWIGFLFGLQFEVRFLQKLPSHYFVMTSILAGVTFLIIFFPLYFLFYYFVFFEGGVSFIAAATLGSAGSCTAQSALAIVNRNYRIPNKRLLELMRYITSVDGLFGLVFFTLALCILPEGKMVFNILKSVQWLFISMGIGIIPAVVLITLSKAKFTQQEYTLFLISTIMFCGGLAHIFNHSPLVAGLIAGIIVANFCPYRLQALQSVLSAEKTIYITLLLLVGASWQFQFDWSLLIAGVYFLLRVSGKVFGIMVATKIFQPNYEVPKSLGLGLISEGGLAIAIIVTSKLLHPATINSLITVIILSIFVNEIIAPKLILIQFKNVKKNLYLNQ